MSLRNFQLAEKDFEKVLELSPGHLLALSSLAKAKAALGEWNAAEKLCNEVLEKDKTISEVWMTMGIIAEMKVSDQLNHFC